MLKLQKEWEKFLKLRALGDNLKADLPVECVIDAECSKLRAEFDKLYAECKQLCAEGDIQWFDAILKTYGNVAVSWKDQNCIVDGDEYKAV